jgi:Skp family chaperone for outer membrane proteins
MNELEIRAQAAYGYVSQRLTQAIDEAANLRAELAARDAQMKAAQDKIAALEAQLLTQAKSDTEAL